MNHNLPLLWLSGRMSVVRTEGPAFSQGILGSRYWGQSLLCLESVESCCQFAGKWSGLGALAWSKEALHSHFWGRCVGKHSLPLAVPTVRILFSGSGFLMVCTVTPWGCLPSQNLNPMVFSHCIASYHGLWDFCGVWLYYICSIFSCLQYSKLEISIVGSLCKQICKRKLKTTFLGLLYCFRVIQLERQK